VRYTERLAVAGAVASVGSRGDSYDNALAESFHGLYKAGLIRHQGPWKGWTMWSSPRWGTSTGLITAGRLRGRLLLQARRRPADGGFPMTRVSRKPGRFTSSTAIGVRSDGRPGAIRPLDTGCHTGLSATGLGAVRSLGRHGIEVRGLDPDAHEPGFHSRYCDAVICPDPMQEPAALLALMLDHGRRMRRRSVLLATSDAFVLFVARHRDQLSQSFLFSTPPLAVTEGLINKRSQYELAQRVGIPIPRTAFPASEAELAVLAPRLVYPAVIKPALGICGERSSAATPRRCGWQLRRNCGRGSGKLLPVDMLCSFSRSCLAQQRTTMRCRLSSGRAARPSAVCGQKIRQYPPDCGVGCLVESYRNDEVVDLTRHLLAAIDYRGVANVEFKLDERDGRFKLIELNARLWTQNASPTIAA